jgi:peptidoglycan-associated lipoprotein
MLPFSHLKPPRRLVFSRERPVFLSFLLLALIGSACSATDSHPVPILSPLPFQNPAGDAAPLRAPSAMEAMSRGIAAVTPPGAALQDVYYKFDSTDLAADAQAILSQNAEWLKNNPKSRVEVEGHCDDLGSNEYNLALGAKRAQSAKDFLVNQGIAPERLVTISYGKEAPACFESTDECRVKNRRARFVIFTELPTS